eukprot:m.162135 g.162135  ORF g.162135 m.162135 type:complete len:106 (+) comp23858_c2_seq3:124-441(+)
MESPSSIAMGDFGSTASSVRPSSARELALRTDMVGDSLLVWRAEQSSGRTEDRGHDVNALMSMHTWRDHDLRHHWVLHTGHTGSLVCSQTVEHAKAWPRVQHGGA